ncbi:hypothetical protein BDR06DRAFT_899442, partial [Suillus hirtellus]
LFQLRMGHLPLNKHLPRISKSPTARCRSTMQRARSISQTLPANLPKYARQRAALREEVGRRPIQLRKLFSDRDYTKPLLRYIARTRRLEQVFGDVYPPTQR